MLQTTVHDLWLGLDINEAVDSKRLHHQLLPMQLRYEEGFEQVTIHHYTIIFLLDFC